MAPISKLLQEVPRLYPESLVLLSSSVPNSAFLTAKLPYYLVFFGLNCSVLYKFNFPCFLNFNLYIQLLNSPKILNLNWKKMDIGFTDHLYCMYWRGQSLNDYSQLQEFTSHMCGCNQATSNLYYSNHYDISLVALILFEYCEKFSDLRVKYMLSQSLCLSSCSISFVLWLWQRCQTMIKAKG